MYLAEDMWSLCQALGKPDTRASREDILATAVTEFEKQKRLFNGFSGLAPKEMTIRINGIKAIRGKPIRDDRIVIPRYEISFYLGYVVDYCQSSKICEIFDIILCDVIRMSREQIEAANTNGGALGLKVNVSLNQSTP